MDKLNNFLKTHANNENINIMLLIEKLRKRYHSKCKNCDGEAFIIAFTDFIRKIECEKLNFLDNLYKNWIKCRIKCFGYYGITTKESIEKRLINDIELYKDIKCNGLKHPILLYLLNGNIEINGYHRLIIWKELGNIIIKYRLK